MEKQVHSHRTEIQSNGNQNISHANHIEQTLIQEGMKVEIIKRIMSEKKSTLRSHRNQNWKRVNTESGKDKRIINTYLNELHHRI